MFLLLRAILHHRFFYSSRMCNNYKMKLNDFEDGKFSFFTLRERRWGSPVRRSSLNRTFNAGDRWAGRVLFCTWEMRSSCFHLVSKLKHDRTTFRRRRTTSITTTSDAQCAKSWTDFDARTKRFAVRFQLTRSTTGRSGENVRHAVGLRRFRCGDEHVRHVEKRHRSASWSERIERTRRKIVRWNSVTATSKMKIIWQNIATDSNVFKATSNTVFSPTQWGKRETTARSTRCDFLPSFFRRNSSWIERENKFDNFKPSCTITNSNNRKLNVFYNV